ncbi:hypothetical protein COV18_00665 [Candidatus Woesearchaeota archaeon CG10_big_fil_rev_8_21_14_0_10_37_12]|nr:MAG: hypothetical protein COV18_00665 [Candidatus Woesearchaeota archaeon CG10_big_fil_rev_8_21_14_0_10_37_12]
MILDTMNEHIMKIIVASRPVDSINAIAQRIGLSYGWTYKWVKELEKRDVFCLTRKNAFLQEHARFYKETITYIHSVFSKNVRFHYEILSLFGIQYSFTKTDAVFLWTRGGYNIARSQNHYPIFIKVVKKNKKIFEYYCNKLGITSKNNVFYSVTYVDVIEKAIIDDIPVDSLDETMQFMQENKYNFLPAIEMIEQQYGKKKTVKYKEVVTNV